MDQQLELLYMQKMTKGDLSAFDALFMHYQPKVIYFIDGFIKDNEEARDMAQDIFLKVWNNKEKLVNVNSFKSYLFQMSRNAVYDHFDHLHVKEKHAESMALQPEIENEIESDIYARELELTIEMAIENMPSQRKLIYTMSRKEGISNDEIAHTLGVSKRTIENQLSLALSTIRKITKLVNLFFL